MASAEPIEVVSWDVDGTLYEMRRVVWALWRLALERPIGQAVRELRQLGRVRRAMAAVRRAGGKLPEGPPRDLELETRWYGAALERVGARPGLRELIAELDAAGVRQVVLSDYRAEYKLERLGLAGAFSTVIAGESLGWLKPAPELYRAVAAQLGVAPARVLHIGDRADTDGAAAEVGFQVAILGRDWRVADDLRAAISRARGAAEAAASPTRR